MFLRDMSEEVRVEVKSVRSDPSGFGQVEKWTSLGTIWASVKEVSADGATLSEVKASSRNNTEKRYMVSSRELGMEWAYGSTRFVWLSSDGDPEKTRYLKPKTSKNSPGRQGRRWSFIICEDITDLSGDKKPK